MKITLDRPLAIIGSGFLRTALLHRIGACLPGATVRVLSTVPPEPVPGIDMEHVPGRTTDQEALYQALTGADAVIHLGTEAAPARHGHRRAESYPANVAGTAAITSAAISQGCRHVLFCSTADVYGEGAGRVLDETDPPAPQSRAARAKLVGERLVEQFGRLPGRVSTVVRLFGPYGPGQPAESTIGRILACALTGHPISLPGPDWLRTFTFSEDAAAGILAALCRPNTETLPHACYNIASCETFSLRDVAKLAISLTGSTSAITVPRPVRRRPGRERPITVQIPSTERAAADLGFRATTLLTEGLSRCILHAHTAAPAREAGMVTA